MAYPATHIVLAQKSHNKYFKDKDKKKFIIGTNFPDIRHLIDIPREITHEKGLIIEDLTKEDPFTAGYKLHSYIDEKREDFVIEKGIYEITPRSKYIRHAMKFFEDQILYDKIKDWTEHIKFMDDILDEELEFGVPKEDVERWHRIIQTYIGTKPDADRLVQMFLLTGRTEKKAKAVVDLVEQLKADERMIKYTEELYSSLI